MPNNKKSPTQKTSNSRTPQQSPNPTLLPPVKADENAECSNTKKGGNSIDNCKEKPKHWTAYVEAWCAVLLVLITATYTHYAYQQAGAAINAANATASAARTAAQTLEMDRPYVSLDVVALSDLQFLPDGRGSIRLGSVAIDYGRNPALNAQIAVQFLSNAKTAEKRNTDPTAFCESLENQGKLSFDSLFGGTYFPNVQNKGSWTPEEMDTPAGPLAKAFMPILVACVAYQSQFSSEWFYTGKMYNIHQIRHGKMPGVTSPLRGKPIPRAELEIDPFIPHEVIK